MEGLRNKKRNESREVQGLIQNLGSLAPQENAMRLLTAELHKALTAADMKNNRLVEQTVQKSYEYCNALAAKQFDVLPQFEEVIQKIRALAQGAE